MAEEPGQPPKQSKSADAVKSPQAVKDESRKRKLSRQSSQPAAVTVDLPQGLDACTSTPTAYSNTHKKVKLKQISSAEAGGLNHQLEDEPYYHGFLSPAETEPLLKHNGDFLVRKAELCQSASNPTPFVISILKDNVVLHFLIKRTETKRLYYVFGYAFKTVPDLILFHYRNNVDIGNEVVLKRFIRKQDWQLLHEQVERVKKIGEGAFGEVYTGVLNIGVFKKKTDVAIKTLHTMGISFDEQLLFLREANLMKRLNHPNIIKLYGVCTSKEPIMIVMELAKYSLVHRINKVLPAPTVNELINYCYGTVCGMCYLESQHILHRDLAARNCLIGFNNDVKISDFGLSLLGMEVREKIMKNVPIRWLAPETLKLGHYSSKSDVWSFGIMIWECFSECELPYNQLSSTKLVRRGVIDGTLHLDESKLMPAGMKSIMSLCLVKDPEERADFTTIRMLILGVHNQYNPPTLREKMIGFLNPSRKRPKPSTLYSIESALAKVGRHKEGKGNDASAGVHTAKPKSHKSGPAAGPSADLALVPVQNPPPPSNAEAKTNQPLVATTPPTPDAAAHPPDAPPL